MFGDKLKRARVNANLKQSELAKILETTNTTISNWENNVSKPDLDMIEYICGALNVPASYFFNVPDDPDDDPDAPYQLVGQGLTGGERLVDTPKHAKISEIRFYLEQLNETQLDTVLQFVKFTADQK